MATTVLLSLTTSSPKDILVQASIHHNKNINKMVGVCIFSLHMHKQIDYFNISLVFKLSQNS